MDKSKHLLKCFDVNMRVGEWFFGESSEVLQSSAAVCQRFTSCREGLDSYMILLMLQKSGKLTS